VTIASHAREPNGRRSRAAEYAIDTTSPTAARRLRDAALRGMAAPEWGTELGRLFLVGELTAPEYVAGKRWATTVKRYHEAIDAGVVALVGGVHASAGSEPDPDSAEGRRRLKRARQAVAEMHAALTVLERVGKAALAAVRHVTEQNRADLGWSGLIALRNGLAALVAHWGLRHRRD
jgi:hypothetical protein